MADVTTHRHPTDGERERDREVLYAVLKEWEDHPDPQPDLPTWLNGACTALLVLRDRTRPDHSGCPSSCPEHAGG